MKKRDMSHLIPLTSYDQVPEGMTEDEAHEFWSTHAITEEYLASAPPVPDDELPPVGQLRKYGPVRLDREVFRKARWLARRRDVRLEEFIGALIEQELAAEMERIRSTAPKGDGVGRQQGRADS
jgi:hypothetical protein